MNEEKGQGIIIAGIFVIWLYNTGRLSAMLAVLQTKTTVSPLASPPLPAKHQEQQQGGGNGNQNFLLEAFQIYMASGGGA